MYSQTSDKRLRPGFALALTCSLPAMFLLLWFGRPKPSVPSEEISPATAVEPASQSAPQATAASPAPSAPPSAFEEKWGIQVLSVALTQVDAALEVHYKVVAPEKAASLAEGKTALYLLDEESGAKIERFTPPPPGALPANIRARTLARMMRQAGDFPPSAKKLAADATYSLLLPNWDKALKRGSRVAVVIGDTRMDNILLE